MLDDRSKGARRRASREAPQEVSRIDLHQGVLLDVVHHIIDWVNNESQGLVFDASIPRKRQYDEMNPVLTILDPPTRDPGFLALEEHLQSTPLWDGFQRYREVRRDHGLARREFNDLREEAARQGVQEMLLAELLTKRDELRREMDSLQKKVSQGFQEIRVAGRVPGVCRHCEGTGGG